MKVSNKQEFTQDIDTIFAAYTTKAFLEKKLEDLGESRNIEVTVQKNGDTTTVVLSREVTAEIPGPVKKFFKPWNKMVQTEVWQGSTGGPYTCNIVVDAVGVPVTVKSQMSLKAKGTGCYTDSTTEIKSSIPFVGRVLAKVIAEGSAKGIEKDANYIRQFA